MSKNKIVYPPIGLNDIHEMNIRAHCGYTCHKNHMNFPPVSHYFSTLWEVPKESIPGVSQVVERSLGSTVNFAGPRRYVGVCI